MRKSLFIPIVLLLSSMHCFAAPDYNASWQKANAYYQQKQYDSAAYWYEDIAALKPQNAELYYNLGNTYYRLNKIGPSVLNYERALRISPNYKEAQENLMLAQSRIPNNIRPISDIFFVRWWNAMTAPQNASTLAVIAAVIFILYISLLILRRLRKMNASSLVQGILIASFLCFLLLSFFATKNSMDRSGAVVMESESPLMPTGLKGKPLSLLPEGTVVKIIDERADWFNVRLPDGREGWLRQDVVTRI